MTTFRAINRAVAEAAAERDAVLEALIADARRRIERDKVSAAANRQNRASLSAATGGR